MTFAPMMKLDFESQRLVKAYHCGVFSSGSGGHRRSSEIIGGHRRSQWQTWSTSTKASGSASAASSKASPLNRYLLINVPFLASGFQTEGEDPQDHLRSVRNSFPLLAYL